MTDVPLIDPRSAPRRADLRLRLAPSTRLARLLALAALLGGAPACDWILPPVTPTAMGDPPWNWVTYESVGDAILPKQHSSLSARGQGANDFGCPMSAVTARKIREASNGILYRVDGCGHGGMYVQVEVVGLAPGARPDAHRTPIKLRGFVNVSRDDVGPAFASLERHAASLHMMNAFGAEPAVPTKVDRSDARLERFRAFGVAAARDLACPRESLVLDIAEHTRAPSTYLAEGCGYRGLFVENGDNALVITSRVSIVPPAPTPATSP